MGLTIPSFRQAVWMEYRKWEPFRNALDKSDRKKFDQIWEQTSLYNSAMSYCANPVRIYPILMSMVFHNYQRLTALERSIRRIENQLKSNDRQI
jgi:hypothetical protein